MFHFHPSTAIFLPWTLCKSLFFGRSHFVLLFCFQTDIPEVYYALFMSINSFIHRHKGLLTRFRSGISEASCSGGFRIVHCGFESDPVLSAGINEFTPEDEAIGENRFFTYPVFMPEKPRKDRSSILLLHGLNERNWDKYLCWAEYLTVNTQKPVILFPIAFHMNRGPSVWSNPRSMAFLMEKRTKEAGISGSQSFANAALSERLTTVPGRFYRSGHQTISDITLLARQAMGGTHPLFREGTTLDIFSYSIGSFLAEILMMANPESLFSTSRLFIFCGGAVFREMYGESRFIMDRKAYDRLLQYYCEEWFEETTEGKFMKGESGDALVNAFSAMINPDNYKKERRSFFQTMKGRISGISLLKDKVIPYSGVVACMGNQFASESFELTDFPFPYTHESPFPSNGMVEDSLLENAFRFVFRKSAAFLA